MGTLTLAGFRAEVQFALDQRQDLTNPLMDQWINWAYLHVSMPTVFRHRELQNTQNITLVDGTQAYALNTNITAVYGVHNSTDGYKLRPNDIREFDLSPAASGQPREFAIWGNQIFFRATPGATDAGDIVVVRYWEEPTDLEADTDATVLRQMWDEVITLGAIWRGWRSLNRPDREEIFREIFASMINEVTEAMQVEGEDFGWEIRPEIERYQEF